MNVQLNHLALHQLVKNEQGELCLQLRSAPLESNAQA